jgi:hypothetical protein
MEAFLLELGDDFAFVGRQRRLRLDDEWYRVDLVFFHRRLRCLVVVDLKVGKFTHADAGQMHLYLHYAREHWMKPGENAPVGLILRASKREAVARYALEDVRGRSSWTARPCNQALTVRMRVPSPRGAARRRGGACDSRVAVRFPPEPPGARPSALPTRGGGSTLPAPGCMGAGEAPGGGTAADWRLSFSTRSPGRPGQLGGSEPHWSVALLDFPTNP